MSLAIVALAAGTLSLSVANEFFATNYEYFDIPYRQGETVFGDVLEATLDYRESEELSLHLGGEARKLYDGGGFDQAHPLVAIVFRPEQDGGVWRFGSLPRRHGFVPQIYDPLQELRRPYLDGFEFASEHFTGFLNWDLFDTKAHGERFSANLLWSRALAFAIFSAQARWTHQGGQLNPHPETGVVHDRVASVGARMQVFEAGGFRGVLEPKGLVNRFSSTADERLNHRGWGAAGRAELTTPGPDLAVEAWRSRDFFTGDGDPVYRSSKMSSVFLFKEISRPSPRLQIFLEGAGRWLEGKFANSQLVRVQLTFEGVRR